MHDVNFPFSTREPDIEKATGFQDFGFAGTPSWHAAVIHSEKNHEIKLTTLCAVKRREIQSIAVVSETREMAQSHSAQIGRVSRAFKKPRQYGPLVIKRLTVLSEFLQNLVTNLLQ